MNDGLKHANACRLETTGPRNTGAAILELWYENPQTGERDEVLPPTELSPEAEADLISALEGRG